MQKQKSNKSVADLGPVQLSPRRLRSMREREARFRAMTKPQQRVAIAKDVLSLLWQPGLRIGGAYVDIRFPGSITATEVLEGFQLQPLLCQDMLPSCTVCGIGALLLSSIRIANEFKTTDANCNLFGASVYQDQNRERLRPYFSLQQLRWVEAAFERASNVDDGRGVPARVWRFADDKHDRPTDKETRLRLIMKNIVANDGTFVPPPRRFDRE